MPERAAAAHGVALFGDLPFMVDADSADVWARQHQFRLDVSVGAPPDAFSATGQDWGMPVYRWDAIAADDFRWLRDRARRSADLYDGLSRRSPGRLLSHLRPAARRRRAVLHAGRRKPIRSRSANGSSRSSASRAPRSSPRISARCPTSCAHRSRESACPAFASSMGAVLARRGQPFRDPADYPAASVAASGTHDTEPMAMWWDRADADERRKVAELPTVQRLDAGIADSGVRPGRPRRAARGALRLGLRSVHAPIQDVFGWRDRINEPATVDDENWTFQLPWPSDRLSDVPDAVERQRFLRGLSERYRRI